MILELVLDLEIKCWLRCNRTRFSSLIVLLIYWKLTTWSDLDLDLDSDVTRTKVSSRIILLIYWKLITWYDLDLDRYVAVHTYLKPFSTLFTWSAGFLSHNLHFRLWVITSGYRYVLFLAALWWTLLHYMGLCDHVILELLLDLQIELWFRRYTN